MSRILEFSAQIDDEVEDLWEDQGVDNVAGNLNHALRHTKPPDIIVNPRIRGTRFFFFGRLGKSN